MAKAWVATLGLTAAALIAAAVTDSRVAGWLAVLVYGLLIALTYVAEVVLSTSERSARDRKSVLLRRAAWVAVAVVALAGALIVQATVSPVAGAALAAAAVLVAAAAYATSR